MTMTLGSEAFAFTICYTRSDGLGEARTFACPVCRCWRRFWLFTTQDAWYDPEWFWQCDTCGHIPRRNDREIPPYRGPEPLLWKFSVARLMDRIQAGAA